MIVGTRCFAAIATISRRAELTTGEGSTTIAPPRVPAAVRKAAASASGPGISTDARSTRSVRAAASAPRSRFVGRGGIPGHRDP